jgi:UDP-N-acetylmuramoyl-tripeptide--D-alanyl-D-alanine ligase
MKKIIVQVVGLAIFLVSFFVGKSYKIGITMFYIVLLGVLLREKGCLKLTNRVKRFIWIYFVVTWGFFLITPENKLDLLIAYCFTFYLFLFVVHLVSCFIENLIMSFYIRDAKKIIRNVKVIGITGSYGKTSCKNIIYDMLSSLLNISKTPKSFNNKVGIVKSIRECVDKEDDYFVCEYGVDKKGAMDKLLRIVKPNIALITEVGPQHILTFKTVENIKNEKIKVAKSLEKDEIAVINNDNNYLREEIADLKCKVITYGINNESQVMAKNIIMSNKGSSFDLYINGKKYKTLNICLLGEHNILNVLGSIGVLMSVGINLNKLSKLTSLIKPVEHRLELKKLQGVKIIDDGFNSNEVGFKKAVDVLNLMSEEKWIITPGVIEQGKNSVVVNYDLGKYMANKIDYAILIETNAQIIKEGLLSNFFDENKITIKKDFKEAWEFVKEINDENKIFLIENDLPSIYLK